MVNSARTGHPARCAAWALTALLAGCGDAATDGTGPGGAALALTPEYPPGFVTGSLNLVVDQIKVRVVRPPAEWVLDTTAIFPAQAQSVLLRVQVPLKARSERLDVVLELWAGPQLVFAGGRQVEVLEGAGSGQQASIPLTYRGPGADARFIRITPRDTSLAPGDTLRFRVIADDGAGSPVPNVYVNWNTSGNPGVSVTPAGLLTAAGARGSVLLGARSGSGARDSTRIWFSPPAATLAVTGGGSQAGVVATDLPTPLDVRVLAADGIPVPGVIVRFISSSGTGRTVPSEARTNEHGVVSVRARLGIEAGPQFFLASVAGVPATAQFLMQALPASVSRLLLAGGDAQVVEPGAIAPLSLDVRATDRFGNPVSGVAVSWEVLEGGGTLNPAESTTDAAGMARVSYRMGFLPVTNRIRASLADTDADVAFVLHPAP